jgi:hypothetical protein
MTDRIICEIGEGFALAADDLQWVLMRARVGNMSGWRPISFVSSTKTILARCMREKGVREIDANRILATLPDTFSSWLRRQGELATADLMLRDKVEGLQPARARVAIHEVAL